MGCVDVRMRSSEDCAGRAVGFKQLLWDVSLKQTFEYIRKVTTI